MISSPEHLPAGTIGLITGELTRYAAWSASMMALEVPAGTQCTLATGVSVAENCNRVFRQAKGEWVWMLGDDHDCEPDTLIRLLRHEVDVVAPLCVRRKPPLAPVVYSDEASPGKYVTLNWRDLPPTGLVDVAACGTAGMLVRKHVIDALPDPWFVYGRTQPDMLGEDLTFCKKVRDAGFKIHVDVDTVIGHITPVTLRPRRRNGAWSVGIDLDNNVEVFLHE